MFKNKEMKTLKLLLIIVIVALISALILMTFQWLEMRKELNRAKEFFRVQQMNVSIVGFTNLFINKVLKSIDEVSIEDRLKLENAVREIGDKDILDQWNRFLASKDQKEAQVEVKNLLEILMSKISYPS